MSAALPLAALLPSRADVALGWYALLSIALTWPLSATLATRIAGDVGDPVLICWVIGWVADHFARALSGEPGALAQLWHANIFAPERYALAYSEAMLAPAAQALPIYLLTGNLILCYNLLVLATYALSGFGMYLLVREITGNWRASFVAGLILRILSLPRRTGPASARAVLAVDAVRPLLPAPILRHRPHLDTRRRRCGVRAPEPVERLLLHLLLAARAALRAARRCSSAGVWRMRDVDGDRKRGHQRRRRDPAALVAVRERAETAGISRTMDDVMRYSADVLSYATATEHNTLWAARGRVSRQ